MRHLLLYLLDGLGFFLCLFHFLLDLLPDRRLLLAFLLLRLQRLLLLLLHGLLLSITFRILRVTFFAFFEAPAISLEFFVPFFKRFFRPDAFFASVLAFALSLATTLATFLAETFPQRPDFFVFSPTAPC